MGLKPMGLAGILIRGLKPAAIDQKQPARLLFIELHRAEARIATGFSPW